MRTRRSLSWLFVGVLGIACNAVLGMEQLDEAPPDKGTGAGAEAGETNTGGSAGASAGKGGTAGSGTSKGGRGGTGGASTSGAAGESGAGVGGGGEECDGTDTKTCGEVYPTLLGNCRDGVVRCDGGQWGDCSVTAEDQDACDVEGDDADCDGTPNGGCPCVDAATRACGPDTEDGICQRGTQTCDNEIWGPCNGAVFPETRDCMSPDDNDCDGSPDNLRDSECPCAVDGDHVCVEDAPTGWEGPAALATAGGTSPAPSCSGTGYERQVASLFGIIDEGSPTCQCGCGDPPGMQCGTSIGIFARSTSQACQLAGQSIADTPNYTIAPGSCQSSLASNTYFKPVGPTWSTTGNCAVQRTATIPMPRWTRRMTACETNDAEPAGCSAQAQCMPELVNPLQAFCIYKAGENACPSGPYSAQTIYYEDFTDGRSCSACSCGSPTGHCDGFVDFAYGSGSGCSRSFLLDRANYGQCIGPWDGSMPPLVGTASTPMPVGSCAPSGGSLQGTVAKSGALTVCCKP